MSEIMTAKWVGKTKKGFYSILIEEQKDGKDVWFTTTEKVTGFLKAGQKFSISETSEDAKKRQTVERVIIENPNGDGNQDEQTVQNVANALRPVEEKERVKRIGVYALMKITAAMYGDFYPQRGYNEQLFEELFDKLHAFFTKKVS